MLARVALHRLGLVGKGRERDRRPTRQELDRIIEYADANPRQTIPLGRIIKFAVATAMRLDEICQLRLEDTDVDGRIAIVRDRKDPRQKTGNHQEVPLLDVNGYDPVQLIREELRPGQNGGRIFRYNSRSTGTAFRRTCKALGIKDLHFHDLRHEATSRLFEAGYDLAEVALVTGHKDWKMLRRYLNLKPRQLVAKARAARRYEDHAVEDEITELRSSAKLRSNDGQSIGGGDRNRTAEVVEFHHVWLQHLNQ